MGRKGTFFFRFLVLGMVFNQFPESVFLISFFFGLLAAGFSVTLDNIGD